MTSLGIIIRIRTAAADNFGGYVACTHGVHWLLPRRKAWLIDRES